MRRTDDPFAAVRVVARFADGVIRHTVVHEIFVAFVQELVRLVRREEKSIAGADLRDAVLIPDRTLPEMTR